MARGYRPVQRDQEFLLPPNMKDWLPEDHLVWFVIDVVDRVDTHQFHAERVLGKAGRRAHDPDMLLALLIYAYAVGERSSRRIERLCQDNVAFRIVCGQDLPDHCSIARFRAAHEKAFTAFFAQVLGLCAQAGMGRVGTIAIDGTKISANASRGANRSEESLRREAAQISAQIAETIVAEASALDCAEDAERSGDSDDPGGLPEEFASHSGRAANIAKAMAALDQRHAARQKIDDDDANAVEVYLDKVRSGEVIPYGPLRSGVDPVRLHEARIAYLENKIASLEGVRGPAGFNPRKQAREALKRSQGALQRTRADIAAGQAPDLRSKSERDRANRAKKAHKRGASTDKVNLTDPDSRLMVEGSGGGSVQGYNTQFAVSDDHLVVGVHVTGDANDMHSFLPTLQQATTHAATFDTTIDLVLMDAGYFSDHNITAQGPDRLIAPGKNRDLHTTARDDPTDSPPTPDMPPKQAMAHRLRNPENVQRYKRRGATVEPVFGHLKNRIRFRQVSRRGMPAANAEIHFAATILNLLRLHALQTAT